MRGKNTDGRFSVPFELRSVSVGLEQDLQSPMRQFLHWWRLSTDETRIDPVYDVGDAAGGRVWKTPVKMWVMRHSVEQGPLYPNDRGLYTQDDMTFIVNESEFRTKMPDVAYVPDPYLLDRITWRGKVFHPTYINPRAHLHNTAVTVVIRATQINPEELVNDPQFNWASHRTGGQWGTEDYEGSDVTGTANLPTPDEDLVWLPPPE